MAFVDGAIGHVFQPGLQAGARFSRDGILSGLHLFHVDTDSLADRQAIVRGAPCHVSGICTGDERFRGRTPRVDAGSADELAFNQGDAHARPGEAVGQRWPGLPRSDDDRVERLDHENDITIRIAPPIAIESSRSAIGRSLPPVLATSLVRNS